MPVDVNNLQQSSKILGRWEGAIMEIVKSHFEQQGYVVQTHRQLNIAWGAIISDVDVAASKDGKLTVIEVKSKQDNIKRVQEQYDNIKDYIDYYWIATDYVPKLPQAIWRCDDRVGHILVDTVKKSAKVLAPAALLDDKMRVTKLGMLPRICLTRLCGISDGKGKGYLKYDLAVAATGALGNNKQAICEIVSCTRDCKNNCPIWHYVQRPILRQDKQPDLSKDQSFLTEYL